VACFLRMRGIGRRVSVFALPLMRPLFGVVSLALRAPHGLETVGIQLGLTLLPMSPAGLRDKSKI